MEIFNRMPAISEDTLQYIIHSSPRSTDFTSVASLAARLLSFVQVTLPNHIWHRDSFELKCVPDEDVGEGNWRLEGKMRVGDSIDDEWCVVWLMKMASTMEDLAIRCASLLLVLFCELTNRVCEVFTTQTANFFSLRQRTNYPPGSRLRMPRTGFAFRMSLFRAHHVNEGTS